MRLRLQDYRLESDLFLLIGGQLDGWLVSAFHARKPAALRTRFVRLRSLIVRVDPAEFADDFPGDGGDPQQAHDQRDGSQRAPEHAGILFGHEKPGQSGCYDRNIYPVSPRASSATIVEARIGQSQNERAARSASSIMPADVWFRARREKLMPVGAGRNGRTTRRAATVRRIEIEKQGTSPNGELAWLLLTYKVPAEPAKRRIALWRKLKALGAVYLQ